MTAYPYRNTGLAYASPARAELGDESVPVMHACGRDIHMTALLKPSRPNGDRVQNHTVRAELEPTPHIATEAILGSLLFALGAEPAGTL
ncbi:hypothetical protein [Nocardia sp. NPDC059239]|uniref:hypothetical protein n=1 Tax=Nocardia sp. NPDC059239 TaxID=3346785 RepID=UPI0036BB83D0